MILRISILLLGVFMSTIAHADWRAEADARIEKVRKGDFVITLKRTGDTTLAGPVKVRQTRSHFLFGTAVAGDPTSDKPDEKRYFDFILAHFNCLVSENDMKWYSNERDAGVLTYDKADRMLAWAKANDLPVRGHCLLWSKRKFLRPWQAELPADELRAAVDRRLDQAITHFKGRVICWDVMNEMLDGDHFPELLGDDLYAHVFRTAAKLDPDVPLYVNEYGILGSKQKTKRYIDLIRDLEKRGGKVDGIGIQEHACERFARGAAKTDATTEVERANLFAASADQIYESLDTIAALKKPIHLTEISSKHADPQIRADGLEVLLRTGFSHPSVEAILVWGFWEKRHWLGKDAAMVDADFNLTESGKRLEQLLLHEWRTSTEATPDAQGAIRFRGFYGDYDLTIGDKTYSIRLTPDATSATIEVR